MRRKDREVANIDDILCIVDKANILHLGLYDDGYPYVVPLHFGYEFAKERFVFYMHSAREGHKLDLIRANPNVCVQLECDVDLVSGGNVPCNYGSTFASMIGRGQAEILSDCQEKCYALSLLMKHQTGKEFEITDRMAKTVEIIKVVVFEFTAKSRSKV